MCRLVLVFGASAAFVAFGVAMQAAPQEKKPETPAAPAAVSQQDRAELGNALDTWYRIETGRTTGAEHVGFSREWIRRQPAGAAWQYDYESETELDLLVPDPKEKGKDTANPKKVAHFESTNFRETRLDDTFAPSLLTRIDDRNGSQTTTNVTLAEGIRTIRILVTPNEFKDHKVSPDEEVYYSRFLMFIALRQNNSLSKPGARKAVLLHPREDGTAATAEVQFQIGEMVKREYLGKKEVSVTPVVFIKPPPAGGRENELLEVYVDRFGRIVEEVTRNGLRRLIVKDKAEAIPKSLMVRLLGRRDPFDKRGPLGGPGPGVKEGDTGAGGVKEVNRSNFLTSLDKVKTLLDELKKAKDENREADGDALYDEIIGYYTGLKKAAESDPQPPDVMSRVESYRKSAEEIWGGVARLVNRARQIWARSIAAYQRDQCEEIDRGIQDLKKIEQDRILAGQTEQRTVTEWIADLGPKLNACKTRIELAKKKIVLSGTTLAEEPILVPVDVTVRFLGHQIGDTQFVKFIKPVRMAIINDKSYRIGDLVEGEGVRVEKIWAHGVQVSLKDETREIGIRQ